MCSSDLLITFLILVILVLITPLSCLAPPPSDILLVTLSSVTIETKSGCKTMTRVKDAFTHADQLSPYFPRTHTHTHAHITVVAWLRQREKERERTVEISHHVEVRADLHSPGQVPHNTIPIMPGREEDSGIEGVGLQDKHFILVALYGHQETSSRSEEHTSELQSR